MAPQPQKEFIILRISFVPYEHPDKPQIYMQRRHNFPKPLMPHVREWFSRVLSQEKSKLSSNQSLSTCEWIISSSNVDLFIINGHRYDSILVILGEDTAHWVFYENMTLLGRIEGKSVINVNYCSCCLGHQYIDILDAVKLSSNMECLLR